MAAQNEQEPYSELSITGLKLENDPQDTPPVEDRAMPTEHYHPIARIATLDSYELFFEPDDDGESGFAPDEPTEQDAADSASGRAQPVQPGLDALERLVEADLEEEGQLLVQSSGTDIDDLPPQFESVPSAEDKDDAASSETVDLSVQGQTGGDLSDFEDFKVDTAAPQGPEHLWEEMTGSEPAELEADEAVQPEEGESWDMDGADFTTGLGETQQAWDEESVGQGQSVPDRTGVPSAVEEADLLGQAALGDADVADREGDDELDAENIQLGAQWDDDDLLQPIGIDVDHSGFSEFSALSAVGKGNVPPDLGNNLSRGRKKDSVEGGKREEQAAEDEAAFVDQPDTAVEEESAEESVGEKSVERKPPEDLDILADIPSAYSLMKDGEFPESFEDGAAAISGDFGAGEDRAEDEPGLYQRPEEPETEVPPEWVRPEEEEEILPPEMEAGQLSDMIGQMPLPDEDAEGEDDEESASVAHTKVDDIPDSDLDFGDEGSWEDMLDSGDMESLAAGMAVDDDTPDMSDMIEEIGGDGWSEGTGFADGDGGDEGDAGSEGSGGDAGMDWMSGGGFQLELPEDEEGGYGEGDYDEFGEAAPGGIDVPNAEGLNESTVEYLRTFEKIRQAIPTGKEFSVAIKEWLRLLGAIKRNIREKGLLKGTLHWLANLRNALREGEYGGYDGFAGVEGGFEDAQFADGMGGENLWDDAVSDGMMPPVDGAVPVAVGSEADSGSAEGSEFSDDGWGMGPGQNPLADAVAGSEAEEEASDMPPDDMLPDEDFSFSTADMLMEDEDLGLNELDNEFDFGSGSSSEEDEEEEDIPDVPGIKGKLLRIKRFGIKWGRLVYKYLDGYANFRGNWWRYLDFLALIILTIALAQLTAYLMWYR